MGKNLIKHQTQIKLPLKCFHLLRNYYNKPGRNGVIDRKKKTILNAQKQVTFVIIREEFFVMQLLKKWGKYNYIMLYFTAKL